MDQLTQFNDGGDGEPDGGDEEEDGEDPFGGLGRGLEGDHDVGCGGNQANHQGSALDAILI